MQRSVVPVILSGGSGTRLWPWSREERPKQFLALVSDSSLLQETAKRAHRLGEFVQPPLLICNEAHRFLVAEQLRAAGITPHSIVLEPVGRNTAAAVTIAALLALRDAPADDDPILLVLPADHVVLDDTAFAGAVEAGVAAATAGRLVTFGVVPTRPETGYGYIQSGGSPGSWSAVERFVEKPDLATATAYVESGDYLWNSGMFVFSARAVLRELERYVPTVAAACKRALAEAASDADFTRLGAAFREAPSISIDNAVMEKTDRAAVVPLAAGWNDIGSWTALHEVLAQDANGNAVTGDALLRACKNSFVASSGRCIVALGLDGVVVVETADAVLVAAREQVQTVKDVVAELKAAGRQALATSAPQN
jgi:mannose-1-phosphate guanylyltransferase/mannose-6-phosphate isomerase